MFLQHGRRRRAACQPPGGLSHWRQQGKLVAAHQPAALAAMEGRWNSGTWAEMNLIGQPNVPKRRLDNPLRMPGFSASSPTAPSTAT